ncbi:MAG: hypothetical protein RLY78_1682 [Pseudomonadota bacterium]|jgi:predicted DNA-binding ribbon-helix-helix protein|uniref:Ribbon-helix-helix domain-containing protein n=1 Tax=Pseudaquabacterium rugosum TaxID=2984194 RepID=A0ABU9BCS9_9BURK
MCRLFIEADPDDYACRTRSVRLHGVVTSIRLENLHWRVLQEIAARDGLSLAQLLERLWDELTAARGEIGNFASFLRVSALRYACLMADGLVPRAVDRPIRTLDVDQVLADEARLARSRAGAAMLAPLCSPTVTPSMPATMPMS